MMDDDVVVREFGIERMILAPPVAGTCPECAVKHAPAMPHNAQSLYYRYKFRQKHGRFPTWSDAMAHCTEDVRKLFTEEMERNGVVVEDKPGK